MMTDSGNNMFNRIVTGMSLIKVRSQCKQKIAEEVIKHGKGELGWIGDPCTIPLKRKTLLKHWKR